MNAGEGVKRVMHRRTMIRWVVVGLIAWIGWKWLYPMFFEHYTGVVNAPLTYDSSKTLNDRELKGLAEELTLPYREKKAQALIPDEGNTFIERLRRERVMGLKSVHDEAPYPHIVYFQRAGIDRYEGPSTCLKCHATMHAADGKGGWNKVNTMDDVVDTVHFRFQKNSRGFSTFGFDGREVNAGDAVLNIPMGKIDRACGIPGSFSWTGWAELVKSKPESAHGEVVMRSEGCGQCHIGGNYHPATEKMMPVGDVAESAKEGIDCLICHAEVYDMNQRIVIADKNGRRWDQDRSLRAAMTVGTPKVDSCLNCHQHNLGGDAFKGNRAAKNLGHVNERFLHEGAKRATPFSPATDVHSAAGMNCLDCHVPEGHKIPRGLHGVDLVANDLPEKPVSCEGCHTAAPHVRDVKNRAILNGHVARLACETCHIKELADYNVVLRDWVYPVWNKEEGVYTYVDVYQSGKPGKGMTYLWFNGNGTFLANALGDNPTGDGRYNPLMNQLIKIDDPEVLSAIRAVAVKLKETYPDIDVEQYVLEAANPLSHFTPEQIEKRRLWVEEKIRPLMRKGISRITPFKLFNARMYEDMGNQGLFGAMILPFDYASYYETGDPIQSVKTAIKHPIVRRMYEAPFKMYMMDSFMTYFGVETWSANFPLTEKDELKNVEKHWMRQMATLMVNHGIQRDGRTCRECHAEQGIIDFDKLGYTSERARELRHLPELENSPKK
ncbi:MAG: nitrite reductase [Magnetococcales bacterium]|nr:nitrite reductase [Magnetococcales bacterium]MBF0348920.1 nitrite reductase [Magnetococcales bacterium]MBF0632872.1 nitrite reductase [Magnetococcales bacterium]